MPGERTRYILIELARARTPTHLITRANAVVRDLDVLQSLSRAAGVGVCFGLPTLDPELARAPRGAASASSPPPASSRGRRSLNSRWSK